MNKINKTLGTVTHTHTHTHTRIMLKAWEVTLMQTREEKRQKTNIVESWITLATGVLYRKVGNDVELNVRIGTNTTYESGITAIGTLPEEYRPKENIYMPVFAVSSSNTGISVLRMLIQASGTISIQNLSNASVTVPYLSTFVRYSPN